ncbi:MAG: PhoH family protein [Acidobacteria bacterium]|jgi:phosphate starvation-inducible PhoH-like protein|nr:PhoH family protein [Acidobacteriota bacterium]
MSELRSEPPALRVAFSPEAFRAVLGQYDANLRLIERTFGVRLVGRDGEVVVAGDAVPAAACVRFLEQLARLVESGYAMTAQDVAAAARLAREAPDTPLAEHFLRGGTRGPGRRLVTPRTARQSTYLDAIRQHELVFAVGPAGTGKTYLAVAMAAEALALRQVRRLVLVRPAVEAGERLGFLPGDLAQKVDPYLRPLYDALFDILDAEKVRKMIEQGVVEIAPLAFMRGRTLNDSFIILDEAQNTTPEQMKMFLTRIGEGSKVVVTGDVTQIDLGPGRLSGLVHARDVVAGIEGVVFVDFDKRDVVRHALVQRIVHAYELHDERVDEAAGERRNGGGK